MGTVSCREPEVLQFAVNALYTSIYRRMLLLYRSVAVSVSMSYLVAGTEYLVTNNLKGLMD